MYDTAVLLASGTTVRHYPYRTARIEQQFLTVSVNVNTRMLEHELADAIGGRVSNHTVYAISNDDNTVYVMFSDNTVAIGLGVREERW